MEDDGAMEVEMVEEDDGVVEVDDGVMEVVEVDDSVTDVVEDDSVTEVVEIDDSVTEVVEKSDPGWVAQRWEEATVEEVVEGEPVNTHFIIDDEDDDQEEAMGGEAEARVEEETMVVQEEDAFGQISKCYTFVLSFIYTFHLDLTIIVDCKINQNYTRIYFMLLRLKHKLPFVRRSSGICKEMERKSWQRRRDSAGWSWFEMLAVDEIEDEEDENVEDEGGVERVGRPVQRKGAKSEDRKMRPATRTCKKEVVSLFYQPYFAWLHNIDRVHN